MPCYHVLYSTVRYLRRVFRAAAAAAVRSTSTVYDDCTPYGILRTPVPYGTVKWGDGVMPTSSMLANH